MGDFWEMVLTTLFLAQLTLACSGDHLLNVSLLGMRAVSWRSAPVEKRSQSLLVRLFIALHGSFK